MDAVGFFRVLIDTKSFFSFRSVLHVIKKVMTHTAHHTPPLSAVCCKQQQKHKTPRAQHCTSNLLIPCAHGKLNVKHHRTTPKPEIHVAVEKAEAALASK